MIKKYSKIIPEEYLAVRWKEDNWEEVRDFVGEYNIRPNPNNPENTFYIVDGITRTLLTYHTESCAINCHICAN